MGKTPVGHNEECRDRLRRDRRTRDHPTFIRERERVARNAEEKEYHERMKRKEEEEKKEKEREESRARGAAAGGKGVEEEIGGGEVSGCVPVRGKKAPPSPLPPLSKGKGGVFFRGAS